MKALYCSACGDIRGLRSDQIVQCACGRCSGGWDEPYQGLAWFYCDDPDLLWGIGLHNGFLSEPNLVKAHLVWQDAVGYAFLTYGSPVVKFKPGQTRDTRWASNREGDRLG